MAAEIIMPKAGMAMETGVIVQWFKSPGESVEVGEALLEIETDKVTMEVEAETSGVLLGILHDTGDEVPVTQTIGYIGQAGEPMPEPPAPGESAPADSGSSSASGPALGASTPSVSSPSDSAPAASALAPAADEPPSAPSAAASPAPAAASPAAALPRPSRTRAPGAFGAAAPNPARPRLRLRLRLRGQNGRHACCQTPGRRA